MTTPLMPADVPFSEIGHDGGIAASTSFERQDFGKYPDLTITFFGYELDEKSADTLRSFLSSFIEFSKESRKIYYQEGEDTKTIKIKRIQADGEWTKVWTQDDEVKKDIHSNITGSSMRFKSYKFWESINKAGLHDEVLNHGVANLFIDLQHDGYNWSIKRMRV